MGRPSKYDWEDKHDICYKLYVEQKLPCREIVKYFSRHFNLAESDLPSSNQFNARFRRWGFPSHRSPFSSDPEPPIVLRIRELYHQNTAVKDMLEILRNEGWSIDQYHLRKLRRKHGMLLRQDAGFKDPEHLDKGRAKQGNGEGVFEDANEEDQSGDDIEGEGQRSEYDDFEDERDGAEESEPFEQPSAPALPPEEAARRAQRLLDLQVQSDRLLQTRKRRRRIRGYGPLPADAAGLEPRYGSETSLDECKAYLHLNNLDYVAIVDQYAEICRDMGVIKMSLCPKGEWQASKDRLIQENAHLSSVLHPLQPDLDRKINALNCICTNVTKRMRNVGKRLTIAAASNVLNLNPMQSKQARRSLYELLEADHFTTVYECGSEHMQELQDQWIAKSPKLQEAVAEPNEDTMKAIQALAKDVRKRYCSDRTAKDPDFKMTRMTSNYGPGPGPAYKARNSANKRSKAVNSGLSDPMTTEQAPSQTQPTPDPGSQRDRRNFFPLLPSWQGSDAPDWRMTNIADAVPHLDFTLDPLLTTAIRAPPWPPSDTAQNGGDVSTTPANRSNSNTKIPAYFRLAPESSLAGTQHARMWLGTLSGPNMAALHEAATSKAGGQTQVIKVQGVMQNFASGSEDAWLVENDDELAVYLAEAREKVTFSVVLERM